MYRTLFLDPKEIEKNEIFASPSHIINLSNFEHLKCAYICRFRTELCTQVLSESVHHGALFLPFHPLSLLLLVTT